MCVVGQHANHLECQLDTADIDTTTFEKLVIRIAYLLYAYNHQHLGRVKTRGTTHPERIQTPRTPRTALARETKNPAEAIGNSSKPSTIDEPRGLKNVFVLIRDFLSTVRITQGDMFGFGISLAFVDLKQFVGDVLKDDSSGLKLSSSLKDVHYGSD